MWTTDQRNRIKRDLDAKINWEKALETARLVGTSGMETTDDVRGMINRFIDKWNPNKGERTLAFVGPAMLEYAPATSVMTRMPDDSLVPDKPDVRVFFVMASAWVDG